MITYVVGDIFYSPARTLVNPVNTVGVMGAGLAYDFKRFYPDMFEHYQQLCQDDHFDIGQLLLHRTDHKWVLNFPTKKHYRAQSKTDYIEAGLQKFVSVYAELGITSVSFPALGTGKGELDWESQVRPIMESYLDPLPISVYVHRVDVPNPYEPESRSVRHIRKWLQSTPERVTFKKFFQQITRLLKDTSLFHTVEAEKKPYRILVSKRKSRRTSNLMIRPNDYPQPIFIAESSLMDLWAYILRAGYVLPQNLPGGLSPYADYLFGLLTTLSYIRPVLLSPVASEFITGLQYIAPARSSDLPEPAQLTEGQNED